jgi:hypothetical protein
MVCAVIMLHVSSKRCLRLVVVDCVLWLYNCICHEIEFAILGTFGDMITCVAGTSTSCLASYTVKIMLVAMMKAHRNNALKCPRWTTYRHRGRLGTPSSNGNRYEGLKESCGVLHIGGDRINNG